MPDSVEVPAGEPVAFNLSNDGDMPHDLTFEDDASNLLDPGETETFEMDAFGEDTTGWCSVPGHREDGMELEVIVTE